MGQCPTWWPPCQIFSTPKVWLTPTTRVRAVMLPRRETRWNLQGCPKLTKRSQPLVGQSSPYCGDMWRRYTKLWDGAEMARFWRFFGSCISTQPRAAHFRPAFQIRTRTTSCVEVWYTSIVRPLRLGEEKKIEEEEKRKKPQGKNIMACPIP